MNAAAISANPSLVTLDPTRAKRGAWISRGLSLVLFVTVVVQVSSFDLSQLQAAMPENWLFWPVMAVLYFALPLADLLIFRRLWGLGVSGFPAILRKRIANELVLSYSGEAWFYLWARRKAGLAQIAFGVIKDVNILSALAANVMTLAMLAFAYPFVAGLEAGEYAGATLISIAVILAVSLIVLLFRRLLFTLPARLLWWTGGVHMARLFATTALLAFAWHLALPSVPIGMWLMLSALRLVVSRLPMLPAKELLFTSISIFLLGSNSETAAMIAFVTGLTLATHIVLAVILAISGLREEAAEPEAVR